MPAFAGIPAFTSQVHSPNSNWDLLHGTSLEQDVLLQAVAAYVGVLRAEAFVDLRGRVEALASGAVRP